MLWLRIQNKNGAIISMIQVMKYFLSNIMMALARIISLYNNFA